MNLTATSMRYLPHVTPLPLPRTLHRTMPWTMPKRKVHAAKLRVMMAVNQSSNRLSIPSVESPSSIETQRQLVPPISNLDVDQELWQLLDLCSDEELELLYSILYSSSPFSPVVKSLVAEKEPALLELRGRLSVMHKVESRFRFLAADPSALLQGRRPAYRETLLSIKDRVEVPCSNNLSTYDLETEIFVFISQNCLEYVQTSGIDPSQALSAAMVEGDGMSSSFKGADDGSWVEKITAPIRFGVKELLPTVWKLGGAAAVTAAGRSAAQKLATQVISSHLAYQTAARSAMAGLSKQVCLEAAQHGLLSATARYSALRGAMSFLGPAMWGALAFDVFLKSIGTDYARVIKAVFVLAQVRLLRTGGFQSQSVNATGMVTKTGDQEVLLASIESFEEDEDEVNIDDTCC